MLPTEICTEESSICYPYDFHGRSAWKGMEERHTSKKAEGASGHHLQAFTREPHRSFELSEDSAVSLCPMSVLNKAVLLQSPYSTLDT